MKISMFALLLCFYFAHVSAHGVQVAHCQQSDGTLRVFVKHWHGYQSGGYYGGDAMSIQVGDEVLTMNAHGYVHNVDVTGLPGCAPGTTPSQDATCALQAYNEWGYWDFTGGGEDGACSTIDTSDLSVTLLDGNNNLFF